MKILSNMSMKSSMQTLHPFTEFPATPVDGQMIFKTDGILYIYSTIDGYTGWRPLTTRAKSYTHTQASAATSWDISHGLQSTDIIYFIYDENNNVMFASDQTFTTNNTMTIAFTEAVSGKAVLFAVGESYASSNGGSAPSSGLVACRFRLKDWSTIADGATVPSDKLELLNNTTGWSFVREDENTLVITHTMNGRPCGHDVIKGDIIDNQAVPPSTLRTIQYINNTTINMYGYMILDDVYITLFFIQ